MLGTLHMVIMSLPYQSTSILHPNLGVGSQLIASKFIVLRYFESKWVATQLVLPAWSDAATTRAQCSKGLLPTRYTWGSPWSWTANILRKMQHDQTSQGLFLAKFLLKSSNQVASRDWPVWSAASLSFRPMVYFSTKLGTSAGQCELGPKPYTHRLWTTSITFMIIDVNSTHTHKDANKHHVHFIRSSTISKKLWCSPVSIDTSAVRIRVVHLHLVKTLEVLVVQFFPKHRKLPWKYLAPAVSSRPWCRKQNATLGAGLLLFGFTHPGWFHVKAWNVFCLISEPMCKLL